MTSIAPQASGRWHGAEAHPLPTGREEPWRYTPVAAISARLARAELATGGEVPMGVIDLEAGRHAAARIVLINGVLAPQLSDLDAVPEGARLVSSATDPTITDRTIPAWDPLDGFDALNRSTASDVVHLRIRAGVAVDDPIHVVHVAVPNGRQVLSCPRLVVAAGSGSRLTLVETHVGLPGGALTNASTVVGLDAGAEVGLTRIQHEPSDAVHVGQLHVTQHEHSALRVTALSLGGSITRDGANVLLAGIGSRVEVESLSAPGPGCRHDTVVSVDHAASQCTSGQRFRSVVAERARSSYSGHVIVRPGTKATDAHQRSDNLLLSPDAQSDSRPWLEIFSDDVRCNHGSATGRLDADALFYLRSRGIPRAIARQMLVEAFVRTVTERLTPASVRQQVEGWLRREQDR